MSVSLRQPLTLEECQQVREWRNSPAVLPMLRTGFKTEEQQAAFYRDVICNPESEHRYYAIDVEEVVWNDADLLEARRHFIGMGGLTFVKDGQAEISLIVNAKVRGQGHGTNAVRALLAEAKRLGLSRVVGECYATGNLSFWTEQIRRQPARMTWEWTL
jgi:RimJ/RimL family protein N-acetyltransferase